MCCLRLRAGGGGAPCRSQSAARAARHRPRPAAPASGRPRAQQLPRRCARLRHPRGQAMRSGQPRSLCVCAPAACLPPRARRKPSSARLNSSCTGSPPACSRNQAWDLSRPASCSWAVTSRSPALGGRLRPSGRCRPDPGELGQRFTLPARSRRRPAPEPRLTHDPARPPAAPPADHRLHPTPRQRRQVQPRSGPLPQALPRPPFLSTTRTNSSHRLTNIEHCGGELGRHSKLVRLSRSPSMPKGGGSRRTRVYPRRSNGRRSDSSPAHFLRTLRTHTRRLTAEWRTARVRDNDRPYPRWQTGCLWPTTLDGSKASPGGLARLFEGIPGAEAGPDLCGVLVALVQGGGLARAAALLEGHGGVAGPGDPVFLASWRPVAPFCPAFGVWVILGCRLAGGRLPGWFAARFAYRGAPPPPGWGCSSGGSWGRALRGGRARVASSFLGFSRSLGGGRFLRGALFALVRSGSALGGATSAWGCSVMSCRLSCARERRGVSPGRGVPGATGMDRPAALCVRPTDGRFDGDPCGGYLLRCAGASACACRAYGAGTAGPPTAGRPAPLSAGPLSDRRFRPLRDR